MASTSIPKGKSGPTGAKPPSKPATGPSPTPTRNETRPVTGNTDPVDKAVLSRETTELPAPDRVTQLESGLLENFEVEDNGPRVTPMSGDEFEEALELSENYGELVSEFDPETFPDSDESRRRLTERINVLAPNMNLEELRHAQGLGADVEGLLENRYRGLPGNLDAASTDLVAGLEHARANGYLGEFQAGFADRFTALEEKEAGTSDYFKYQRKLREDYNALREVDPKTAGMFEREYNSYLRRVGGVQPDFASVKRPPLDDGNHHVPGSPEYRGGGDGHTSTRPENYRELYEQSILDPRDTTTTETFWARDEDGIFHRFSGEPTHWSGSTAEGELTIKRNDISNEIRRALDGRPRLTNSVGLPPPPDTPPKTPSHLRPGKFVERVGGVAVRLGIVGASAASAAINGDDVVEAAGEAVLDQIPGTYSARELIDGRPEEATLGAIEEWPILGTLATEVARPVLQGLGYDVDPSLIQMGLRDGEADRLNRVERNENLVNWLHDIGGATDRPLGRIQFTSLPEAGEGANDPNVHFRIGENGELQRVNSPDDPLGEFGAVVIGLDGDRTSMDEDQARMAATLARAYGLDKTALLRWTSDSGVDLGQIRQFNR